MEKVANSNRKHIAFFGNRNAGKSSLFNLFLGQDASLVSDVPGTTADPVYRAMELVGYGPVRIVDTAGLDDIGELGELRVKKSEEILQKTDMAVYVLDASKDIEGREREAAGLMFQRFRIPHIFVWNKIDLITENERQKIQKRYPGDCHLSADTIEKRQKLISIIIEYLDRQEEEPSLIGDILPYGSRVILVVPVDSEAPKGRLILPQVQVIRDCLDNGIKSYVVRDIELEEALSEIRNVDLVITDSQVFDKVSGLVPESVPLTSFSILYARQKGELGDFLKGIKALERLKSTSRGRVLIAESCTHTTSHEDIGTIKIPALLRKKINPDLDIVFQTGVTFKEEWIENVDVIIHCGSCMITRKNMLNRIQAAKEKKIPITNYGVVLAYLAGILDRAVEIFKRD